MTIMLVFTCGYGVANYLIMVFLPTFAQEFAHVDASVALRINTAGQALALVLVPAGGWLSDRWLRRRPLLALAFAAQAALAWALFARVLRDGAAGLWWAQLVLAGLLALVMGAAPAMLAEQFPPGIRVSAHALALNLGVGLAGGTAPLVAVALIRASHNQLSAAAYLAAGAAAAAVAVLFLTDRSREALPQSTGAEYICGNLRAW
jgi:MHS family proline/betaine transporter-like MFS transporter